MQDFPANSAKVRTRSEGPPQDKTEEHPKKVERITSAEAVQRKRGLGRKFKDTFVGGNARTALEYMFTDVVVPSIRDLMAEAVHAVTDRMIYGDTRPRRGASASGYSNVPHVNYQGMSSAKPTSRALSQQSRTRHDFGEIVIASRGEAEEVLDRLFDILSRYGSVPVADLYELTGIQSSHTDHKWGWTALRGAKVARLRTGGYLLELPNPEPLDR